MAGLLESARVVRGLEKGLGEFRLREGAIGEDAIRSVPLFDQILDPRHYSVAFAPGSDTWQALINDQNRFSPPRSLPPIVDLQVPEDPDNPTGAFVITRHAYTEGAFHLLEDLLTRGHVFSMNGFLEFARSLTQALAWLHRHGIVHGQWNARSVIAVVTEEMAHPLLEVSSHRFEVIGTGVCFADRAAVPREYLERGYYPPEVFLTGDAAPDYGALDLVGDLYCCAAFLKDLMQRACSTEELPSQAQRILEELHKEANRRGWKAAPESVQRKEMEILDHLYTIRVRSETLIQEGLRPRDERSTAAALQAQVEYLHGKATDYLQELFARGFDPVNVFDGELQHYTTFQLEVAPLRVNNHEDSRVVLTGSGLPHEVVRVTLNESHHGVRVLAASPGRIEFEVGRGFRTGSYRISVNNRRTNGALEVFAPVWQSLQPDEVHQPWEGFGNIRLCALGRDLPPAGDYVLRPSGGAASERQAVTAVVVEPVAVEGGSGLQLTFPCDAEPGEYELVANSLPTGLRLRVLAQLPDPVLPADGLQPGQVKNHRAWTLRLSGRDFHPAMKVDFGKDTPPGLQLAVRGAAEAELSLPAGFPAGAYKLRLNHRETAARLLVIEPRWQGVDPLGVRLLRHQETPVPVLVTGESLPDPTARNGYALADAGGQAIPDAVVAVEEVEPERAHRLQVAPALSRGTCTVRFGVLDTGLRLQIRRQWPRAAWAALSLIGLLLLAGTGYALYGSFAPRITGVEPASVFAYGEPVVTVRGAHLAAVELLAADGALAGTFAVAAQGEQYRFAPSGLPPGRYRLRPLGPLYGAPPTGHELSLLSPSLRLEPATVARLQDVELRLLAAAGFDVAQIAQVRLQPADPARPPRDVALVDGRATLARGSFARAEEGDYRVVVDGLHAAVAGREELALRVVGPRVDTLAPNPATLDAAGWIALRVAGANLELPLQLVPEPAGVADGHALEPAADGGYRCQLPPGSYRLALLPAGLGREVLPEPLLTVLPAPAVEQASPDRLEPDRQTTVAVTGRNLAALDRIVLQPAAGRAPPIEAPLRQRDGAWVFEASLPSGSYRIVPAEGSVTLEVYDDCRAALKATAATGEVDALLRCLQAGRPPADVRRAAADLLFDRGLFEAAAGLYAGSDDLVARFRCNFVDALLLGRGVPLLTPKGDDEGSPYAIGAIRLGWAMAAKAEFDAGPLPWELEYVRGHTAAAPDQAVASLQASIERKTRAAGGFEHAHFEPAHRDLAAARLDLALLAIARAQVARARELLAASVDPDGRDWPRLAADRRSLALFWHGHLLLWYAGDEQAAAAAFARAQKLPGPAAVWSQGYLAALGRETPPAAGSGWEGTFVRLFQLHREATKGPNYDLLAPKAESVATLPAGERQKNAELNALLPALEEAEPRDPLAHYALLHAIRNAQRISWPAHARSDLAAGHRARLLGLDLPAELEPLRRYYVVYGDLSPYDYPQVVSLGRAERSDMAAQLEALAALQLPPALLEAAAKLKGRFLGPSVVWWRQAQK